MSTATKTRSGVVTLRPVVREIPADLETPVSVFLKLQPAGARFLLESVEQGETLGRYSFIGVDAWQTYRVENGTAIFEGPDVKRREPLGKRSPLDPLRDLLRRYRIQPHPSVPRLLGGAVGYLSYEFVHSLERIPRPAKDTLQLPLCRFDLANTLVIFDHLRRRILVVSLEGVGGDPADRVDQIIAVLRRPLPADRIRESRPVPHATFASNFTKAAFERAVRRAKEFIGIGDIFQVVLSHRMSGTVEVDPFQVYRALRILNPSPYMFFLDYGDLKLVGSSPEVHVKLEDGTALIRPIAGTRPRGKTEAEDRDLEKELLADEKERAEHVMLIDLARNDLGRCCEYGTVKVSDLFTIERYSHVMHIVSEVRGRLAKGQDAFDLLAGTFPAGTVTGAPKVRAMEIISDLEKIQRGPYAGTVGYFGLDGDSDMCITIRTIVFTGRTAHLQAGAGIVWDSKPEREWQETLNKMAGLRKAIEMAEEGF